MKLKQNTFEESISLIEELAGETTASDMKHGTVTEGNHPRHGKLVIYTATSGPSFYVSE